MKIEDVLKLPLNEFIIAKTLKNSVKKYLYTIQNLTYKRTPVELLDNLYMDRQQHPLKICKPDH